MPPGIPKQTWELQYTPRAVLQALRETWVGIFHKAVKEPLSGISTLRSQNTQSQETKEIADSQSLSQGKEKKLGMSDAILALLHTSALYNLIL